jgi:hypothetical protein
MPRIYANNLCRFGIVHGRKTPEHFYMHKCLRSTLIFATATMCVSVYAQSATLVATYQGKEVGTATYTVGVLPTGRVTKTISVKLTVEGSVYESKATVHFNSHGETLDRVEYAALGGQPKTDLAIRFNSKGATVVNNITGKQKLFPAPADPPARDMSDLWFLTVKPKIGDKVVSSGISSETGWQKTTTTYTGDVPILVGGKTVLGHSIQHVELDGTYARILDDHGVLLQFSLPKVPGLLFTRK